MHANFSKLNSGLTRYAPKKRQHNTQAFILIICTLLLLTGITTPLWAQLPPISHLSTIQTAEPVGKGGSSTTFGLFQYPESGSAPGLRADG